MQIEIDLSNAGALTNLMVNRGARDLSRQSPVKLDESLILPCLHEKRKPIPPAYQLSQVAKCFSEPRGNWWLTIGTMYDEDLALTIANGIMLQAMSLQGGNPPFMWPLYGGTYDKLRDKEEFRQGIGGVGLLLLTNLAENSSREKLEKARDLLAMYGHIPRVLVVSGADPLAFSLNQLHATPTRVLYVGRNAKAKRRQI